MNEGIITSNNASTVIIKNITVTNSHEVRLNFVNRFKLFLTAFWPEMNITLKFTQEYNPPEDKPLT